MTEPRQDHIAQIEQAMLALRHRRPGFGPFGPGGPGPFGPGAFGPGGRSPFSRGAGFRDGSAEGEATSADAAEGTSDRRPGPPWGNGGGPPWAHGRGGGRGGPHARGLGVARIRLLEALADADPEKGLSVSDVAEAVGVDQPRASRLVADAAERGLLTRQPDPRDARRSVIRITDAGRTMLETTRTNHRGAVSAALEGFTEEEQATFAALFSRFAAAWSPH